MEKTTTTTRLRAKCCSPEERRRLEEQQGETIKKLTAANHFKHLVCVFFLHRGQIASDIRVRRILGPLLLFYARCQRKSRVARAMKNGTVQLAFLPLYGTAARGRPTTKPCSLSGAVVSTTGLAGETDFLANLNVLGTFSEFQHGGRFVDFFH